MFSLSADEANALWRACPHSGRVELSRVRTLLKGLVGELQANFRTTTRRAATTMWMAGLESKGWFEPADVPWSALAEGSIGHIRADYGRLRSAGITAQRYLAEDDPTADRQVIDGWKSVFLSRDGRWFPETALRCRATVELFDRLPWFPGDIMFSVLAPGVRIPAHYGLDNLHVTLHIPIEVHGDCGLVVDGETRPVIDGEILIFDDTYRHGAWNLADRPRVHLVADIWHPGLTPMEIDALRFIVPSIKRLNRVSR